MLFGYFYYKLATFLYQDGSYSADMINADKFLQNIVIFNKSKIKNKPNIICFSIFEYKVLSSSLTFYKSFRKSHDSKNK